MSVILEAKNINFSYGTKGVLNNFSCQVKKAERLVVLGSSGCGKTSFLRLCAGFEKPEKGEIYLRGELVSGKDTHLAPGERGLGYVFQNFALFEKINVLKNIRYGCKSKADHQSSEKMIELLKLGEHLDKFPYQLSGGERQKVALARSLCLGPDIILMDEAFSSIDSDQTGFLIDEIIALFSDLAITSILVTHSKEVANQFGTRILNFN